MKICTNESTVYIKDVYNFRWIIRLRPNCKDYHHLADGQRKRILPRCRDRTETGREIQEYVL